MRRDIHVPNESDAFVITSSAMRARGIGPGDRAWAQAITACDLLPLVVESEDPANVRVVVDEALDAAEQDQWVGVVRSALRVPDGELALCGGVAYVLDKESWAEEYVRVIEVPAGEYRATLYCYASAPNGRLCVERSGLDEPLGAWFRRTRSGQDMPAWLHNLCVNDPTLDPGHAQEWKRAAEKRGGYVVDFLLHLEVADGHLLSAPLNADGVMEAGECRRPNPFPLGIPTVNVEGSEDDDIDERPAAQNVAHTAPAEPGELTTIAGGRVDVPVAKLVRVAHIAWLCHPYTHPSLRVTFRGKPPRFELEDVEDVEIAVTGHELRIDFVNNSQPSDALLPLKAVAKQLAAVPDGTVVDLHSARLRTKSAVGAHRYRGTVHDGIWQIDASFPRIDAACLAEALVLTEALESGRRLMARDEHEAARIETQVTSVLADYLGANSLQRTGAELALRRRDPALFARVVARVFWSRYAGIWPLQDEDESP
jgi:hypothetical protein